MANDRVINLPANQIDPDSSGTGAMLFDMLVRKPEEAKQTDILEGIKNKHKMEAQAQANVFDQGMAKLRSQLKIAETEAAWQHEDQLRAKEAAGFRDIIGAASNQGIAMPGLTSPQETPEAGTKTFTPNEINPNALTEARTLFGKNIDQHLKEEAARTGLSTEAAKSQLLKQLDLVDDNDARQANGMADALEAAGDKGTAAQIRALWGSAGTGSRKAWTDFQVQGMNKLQIAKASMASKLAISQEITQRSKDVANIRGQWQRLAATQKVDDKTFGEFSKIHAAYQSQIGGLNRLHQRLSGEYIMKDPRDPEAISMAQRMREIEEEMGNLNQEAAQVRAKMDAWTSARIGGQNPNAAVNQMNQNPQPAAPRSATPPKNPSGPGSWGPARRVK